MLPITPNKLSLRNLFYFNMYIYFCAKVQKYFKSGMFYIIK